MFKMVKFQVFSNTYVSLKLSPYLARQILNLENSYPQDYYSQVNFVLCLP